MQMLSRKKSPSNPPLPQKRSKQSVSQGKSVPKPKNINSSQIYNMNANSNITHTSSNARSPTNNHKSQNIHEKPMLRQLQYATKQ
jgi:hypothetical protein